MAGMAKLFLVSDRDLLKIYFTFEERLPWKFFLLLNNYNIIIKH